VSARADVLLWAQRVLGMKKAAPHLLLEISEHATMEQATAAFHKIARLAHPDLNRALEASELELVTRAYSRVAAAYQDFRSGARERPDGRPATPATGSMSGQMSSKALVHYRKAELALKRGELQVGLLHLKMAIAADPQSGFLREALARVEEELKNA
jgi:hypothetical protein